MGTRKPPVWVVIVLGLLLLGLIGFLIFGCGSGSGGSY
jgi:preprotein translocase subunit Sss1